jgi:glycosyltransferase involved in cell wall biosynthesis
MNSSNYPLVSIIATCYNQAAFVLETLISIENQDYPNLEIIVIDDCSVDDSVSIIRQWKEKTSLNVRFIENKENIGICAALNKAFKYVTGKYYQMIACDDIWFANKTQVQARFLENNKKFGMVYSDASIMSSIGVNRKESFIDKHVVNSIRPSGDIYERLLNGNFIPGFMVMSTTKSGRLLSGWDENLVYEDYDFWLRFAKDNLVGFLPGEYGLYRQHSNNFHKKMNIGESSFWIFRKHLDHHLGREKFMSISVSCYYNNAMNGLMFKEYVKGLKSVSKFRRYYPSCLFRLELAIEKVILLISRKGMVRTIQRLFVKLYTIRSND